MNFPSNNQRYVQLDIVAVKVVGEAERTIGFELVWKGKKPNRTEINRFESVRFKKLKKFGLVVYFSLKPDRIGNAHPYLYLIIENELFNLK
jgi:hypothetical protein